METDARKSLCTATRDQHYVLSGVNAIEDDWKGSYKRNLFANELCTNRHLLYGVDADSAGTWELLCTNVNYVLSGVVLTGNHLYDGSFGMSSARLMKFVKVTQLSS